MNKVCSSSCPETKCRQVWHLGASRVQPWQLLRNCTLNMFLLVVNLNETSRATSKQVHSKHSCTNEELSLYSGKPNLWQGVRIVLWCTRMLMLHRPQIATNYNFKSILVGMYIYIYRVLAINSLTFSKCWLRSKKIMFWSLDWYVTC